MLAAQRGCEIHIWANDKGDRYGQRSRASPNTIRQSALLTGRDAHGSATEIGGEFPGTIPHLSKWLATGAARLSTLRIGFLDPDNYMQGDAQVSTNDHGDWLRALANGGSRAISVMFSGCQDHGPGNQERNARLAHFHHDALELYPRSYVFESGTFQTGVKFCGRSRLHSNHLNRHRGLGRHRTPPHRWPGDILQLSSESTCCWRGLRG
jgi:hypothetical protein